MSYKDKEEEPTVTEVTFPYIVCPHCSTMIEVVKLNCRIFRCGIYKSTGKQIDPHLAKPICDQLARDDLIYGCGKPFQIVELPDGKNVVEICDYI